VAVDLLRRFVYVANAGNNDVSAYTIGAKFAKKQQMQWTKKNAHLVLQMRTQVLDERLEYTFRNWYPEFRRKPPYDEFNQAA
jgi:hypothetical protein